MRDSFKRFAASAAMLVALLGLSMSVASAQGSGSGAARAAPTPQALAGFSCGPMRSSVVRTENTSNTTSSTSFATLPGASIVVNVPAGTHCIKVHFTAETSCSVEFNNDDICYVRALDNGVEMHPRTNERTIDSENDNPAGHGYEWIIRVNGGAHTIVIQRRVQDSSTSFRIDDWTFDVEVF